MTNDVDDDDDDVEAFRCLNNDHFSVDLKRDATEENNSINYFFYDFQITYRGLVVVCSLVAKRLSRRVDFIFICRNTIHGLMKWRGKYIYDDSIRMWTRARLKKLIRIYALTHHQFMIAVDTRTHTRHMCVPRIPHTRNMFINYFLSWEQRAQWILQCVVAVDFLDHFDLWEFRTGRVIAFDMAIGNGTQRKMPLSYRCLSAIDTQLLILSKFR